MAGLGLNSPKLASIRLLESCRTPVAVLRSPRDHVGRQSARSSGRQRMPVSPRFSDDEQDLEEPMTPVSQAMRHRRRSTSSASSMSRSPSVCESDYACPSSAGSGSRFGSRRRVSISDLSEKARMTPEALAERGAGFPWLCGPGICKIELGTGKLNAADASEAERARSFCLLATPELCGDASPLEQSGDSMSSKVAGQGAVTSRNKERLSLHLSFEDQVLEPSRDSPSSQSAAHWLPPPCLAQRLRCPDSFKDPCNLGHSGVQAAPPATLSAARPAQLPLPRRALPAMPTSAPPSPPPVMVVKAKLSASPPARPPQKRLRPASRLAECGGG